MDMSMNIGEIRGSVVEICSEDVFLQNEYHLQDDTLIIDGIDITAHRLFGPRPRTRTYTCVWEIDFGSVRARLSLLESQIIVAAIDTLRINYADLANAPSRDFCMAVDPDLTFVKFSLKSFNITIMAGIAAIDVHISRPLMLHTNDLQGQICALVASGSSRRSWSEAIRLEFDSNIDLYKSNIEGNDQSTYLRVQDLTRRADHLLSQVKEARTDFCSKYHSVRQHSRVAHPTHLSGFYLPQLNLPQFRTSASFQQHRKYAKSSPWKGWSRLSHLSESEDENISEADRDARVARNRTFGPVQVVDIDEAEQTISDEESDNEDITDTASSDSDLSLLEGRRSIKTFPLRYKHLTRRYDGHKLENFFDHYGSPFILMHEPSFRKPEGLHRKAPWHMSTSLPPGTTGHAFRLESIHGIDVSITPLIITLASCLTEEFKRCCRVGVGQLYGTASGELHLVKSATLRSFAFIRYHIAFLLKSSPQRLINPTSDFQISCRLFTAGLDCTSNTLATSLPELCATLDDIQVTLIKRSYLAINTLHLQYFSNALMNAHPPVQVPPVHGAPKQTFVVVAAGGLSLVISPRLIDFTQRVVRVHKRYPADISPVTRPLVTSTSSFATMLVQLGSLDVRAGAENLTFGLEGSSLDFCSSILVRSDIGLESANNNLTFSSLRITAQSGKAGPYAPEQDALASLTFAAGSFSMIQRSDQVSGALRLVFSLGDVALSVPRSALRLYYFIEEWKTTFLPGFEIAAGSLMSEIKGHKAAGDTTNVLVSPIPKPTTPSLSLNGTITSCGVTLQIMRGTWLCWTMRDIAVCVAFAQHATSRPRNFGLQLDSQALSISYKSPSASNSTRVPRVKVMLPALILSGHESKNDMDLICALEFVDVMLKSSHWDSLLVVQQKFGRDFTDLMDLIQETRRARLVNTEIPRTVASEGRYNIHINMKGFRVGLEGPASTFYLECENVVADIIKSSSELAWKVLHRDISLSLTSRAATAALEHVFGRNQKSAFVVVDISVTADGNILAVSIPKIHAVMQASSIGELGDFIDYHQAEMMTRRNQRAAELEAFKEKTRTILKTFEVHHQDPDVKEHTSWLRKHSITVDVEKIGVAFPLSLEQSLDPPMSRGRASSAVRAILFTVRRIKFTAQRGEVGQMTTKELSLQFVHRFRQWVSMDFIANNHATQNRLCYPEMKIHLRSDVSPSKRHIWVTGNVSGFILDLDSTVSDYVFSLIDVYRRGRERMERLASRGSKFQVSELSNPSPFTDDYLGSVPVLNMFAMLVFESGRIHIHSAARRSRPVSAYPSHDKGDYSSSTEMDTIELPILTAWIEYRASASVPGALGSMQPSILIFKSKIHSSQNTLNPNLLPFVADITDKVQARMRRTSEQYSSQLHPVSEQDLSHSPSSPSSQRLENPFAASSLQISFSLRIDKSSLELTCQPDVNVLAALRWESGGFVMNISPGAHRVTFTGSVDGLTVGLKHGFLSEDCVNLAARNLAFSLAFTNIEGDDILDSSISLIVSTDIAGGIRFSRLQDILCFKAVWLDHIPLIAAAQNSPTEDYGAVTPLPQPRHPVPEQDISIAIIVHIRRTEVTIDLGQSISVVTFNFEEALISTRFSDSSYGVSLSIANVSVVARGNMSGHITVPNCIFRTVHRKETPIRHPTTSRLLELTMTSGALNAELESEQQRLLVYRADPVQVDIHDDWCLISSGIGDNKDRPLLLAFTVHGGEITALATIATIPKLMHYASRFKSSIAAQRLAAGRESEAFRATQAPKPSNPLTEVASAFLQSARDRLKEVETDLYYLIRQQMSFHLRTLTLILFPRTMADAELASFVGRDVHASLHRTVQDGPPSRRELHLSFSAFNISKFTQFQPFLPSSVLVSNDRSWVESLFKNPIESNIIGLPSMKMLMITEQSAQDPAKRLLYDFYSTFQGRDNKKPEDIYITLNVALYSWLTGLRKNLSREMDHLQSSLSSTNNISSTRKKVNSGMPELPYSRDAAQSDGEPMPSTSVTQVASSPNLHSPHPYTTFSPGPPPSDIPSCSVLEPHRIARQTAQSQHAGIPFVPPDRDASLIYEPRERKIQRLTLRQLGEATPDVMHPFFMKKSGFNLEDSLPQYVHEYATIPLEKIMEALLNLYSKQLPNERERQ
ncbi:hypothetical protein ID866_6159 [Astraeus odoratus]|nr:hypothetical protein ID866_6159 [Astraeus odoratus]